MLRILFILLLLPIGLLAQEGVGYSSFEGGRSGYSKILLKLKYDKTFEYDEWTQTGRTLKDKGFWEFDDSSSSIVMRSASVQVSPNYYYNSGRARGLLFQSDTFEIMDGMIYLFDKDEVDAIPEDQTRDPRREFYSFRVLYRVMPLKVEEPEEEIDLPDAFSAYEGSSEDDVEEYEEPKTFIEKISAKLKKLFVMFKEEKPKQKRFDRTRY